MALMLAQALSWILHFAQGTEQVMNYYRTNRTRAHRLSRLLYSSTVLYYDVLYCDVLYCDVLNCDAMYCNVMYCVVL